MKKLLFGGIYIIAGILFAMLLLFYGIIPGEHDGAFLIVLPAISVIVGIIFTIRGLCEKEKEEDEL